MEREIEIGSFLNVTELQDAYGAMAGCIAEKMLKPGEYSDYIIIVKELNGFNLEMDDLVEEAKN
mgnify:CR=1 FL=1